MEYKDLNILLENIQHLVEPNALPEDKYIFMEKRVVQEVDGDHPRQGLEGLYHNIYKIKGEEKFLIVVIEVDSYGEYDTVVGIQFADSKEVTKTVFEPIK